MKTFIEKTVGMVVISKCLKVVLQVLHLLGKRNGRNGYRRVLNYYCILTIFYHKINYLDMRQSTFTDEYIKCMAAGYTTLKAFRDGNSELYSWIAENNKMYIVKQIIPTVERPDPKERTEEVKKAVMKCIYLKTFRNHFPDLYQWAHKNDKKHLLEGLERKNKKTYRKTKRDNKDAVYIASESEEIREALKGVFEDRYDRAVKLAYKDMRKNIFAEMVDKDPEGLDMSPVDAALYEIQYFYTKFQFAKEYPTFAAIAATKRNFGLSEKMTILQKKWNKLT